MESISNYDRWKLACPHDRPEHCPKCDRVLDYEGYCNYCGFDVEEDESEDEE